LNTKIVILKSPEVNPTPYRLISIIPN